MRRRSLSRAARSVTVASQVSEGIAMIMKQRDREISDPDAAQFSEQYLLARLTAAGVGCLDDWRQLSSRARRNIFGITPAMVSAIDRLAKSARS